MSLDGPGGLDLATIQNNAAAPKLIRGSITFDGTAGKGATGTVTLPWARTWWRFSGA